ncbi:OmpA family protein [Palleronia pelagia]|uniref:Outer membrane protein OmpA n=1 Tax=Palleronia pelagia TaxID=387096 RepID=A0A1H8GKQ7_9RHOB|nr:OmpA family protein [Palleronia pelagia]SEN44553.1 Outer membrane protein OmpA [Palleronia pelagia]
MRKTLNTTTALVASLHLAFPHAAFAQQDDATAAQIREVCAEIGAEDCAETLGISVEEVQAVLDADAEGQGAEGAANANAEGQGAANGNAGGQSAQGNANASAQGQAQAAEGSAAADAAEAEAVAEQQAQAEAAAAEEAQAAEEAAAAEAEAAEEAQAQAEAAAAEEAQAAEEAAAAEAEAAAEQQAQAEAAAAEEAQAAEEAAAAEAEAAAEQEAQAEAAAAEEAQAAEEAAAAESEAEATAAAEAEAEAETAENAPSADDEAARVAEGLAGDAETDAETEAQAEVEAEAEAESETAEVENPEMAPENQMTDSERAALEGGGAAEVAATDDDAAPAEEIANQTVTDETARSSTEDFDSAIDRDAAAAEGEAQVAVEEDDDGLSTLQKALIAGAGVLAVGALLNNNRQVVASSQDRVVVEGQDGGLELIKDDTAILQRPGTDVSTERFDDGSTRTTVTREDGTRIVTIRDSDLRVLRRTRIDPDGTRTVLLDDTAEVQAVDVSRLQQPATETTGMTEDDLRRALANEGAFDRGYSLSQVRNIAEVRNQVPAISLDNITFETGSAAIQPEQADELTALGRFIRERIEENPREIFMVEGHTDAVGNAAYNLALSDRRAESVALALTEYFDVPPENLVVQGYGERFLKVPTLEAERANRRATLRRITPLLQVARAN